MSITRATFRDLLLLALLAGTIRLVGLGSIPLCPTIDVTYNGMDARDLIEGRTSPSTLFFPDNYGKEPVIVWLTALSIQGFGYSMFALALPGALIGILTVLAVYWITFRFAGLRAARIAGFLATVGFWPVMLARHGFRAGLIPLIFAFVLLLFYDGVQEPDFSRARRKFYLAAALCGFSLYTYLSARYLVVFLPLGLLFSVYLEKDRKLQKGLIRVAVISTLIIGLMSLPLVWSITKAGNVPSRMGMLLPWKMAHSFGEFLKLVFWIVRAHLGMFVFRGSDVPALSYQHQPLVEPFIGFFIMLGLVFSSIAFVRTIKHRDENRLSGDMLMLLFAFTAILPAMLAAEGIPHPLRLSALIIPAFYFAGKGIAAVFATSKESRWYAVNRVLGIIVIAGSAFISLNQYFVLWAKDEPTLRYMGAESWDVARCIQKESPVSEIFQVASDLDTLVGKRLNTSNAEIYWFAPTRYLMGRQSRIHELPSYSVLWLPDLPPNAVLYVRETDTPAMAAVTMRFPKLQMAKVGSFPDPQFHTFRFAAE